jgi:DNA-binding response OmpR family regulator
MSEPRHLLVVDDQTDICGILRQVLELNGYRVSTAVNGRTGQRLFREGGVDLAIVDALLPFGLSGLQLADEILDAGTPVIVITGSLAVREQLEGARHTFLLKPFRMSELLEKIAALLG